MQPPDENPLVNTQKTNQDARHFPNYILVAEDLGRLDEVFEGFRVTRQVLKCPKKQIGTYPNILTKRIKNRRLALDHVSQLQQLVACQMGYHRQNVPMADGLQGSPKSFKIINGSVEESGIQLNSGLDPFESGSGVAARGVEHSESGIQVIERPKMAPHILKMRETISSLLECCIEQVSVKATTSEQMGFAGTGEGVKVYAVVLITKDGN